MFKLEFRSIRTKIYFTIALTGTIVMTLVLIYSYVILGQLREEKIKNQYFQTGNHSAAMVSAQLTALTSNLQSNAAIVGEISGISPKASKQIIKSSLKNILKKNSRLAGAWAILNSDLNDTLNLISHKSFVYYFYNINNIIGERQLNKNQIKEIRNSPLYTVPATNYQTNILNIRSESYSGEIFDNINVISICLPLFINKEFVGTMGLDIPQKFFQKYMIQYSQNNFSTLVNDNGTMIAHNNSKFIDVQFSDYYAKLNSDFDIIQKIENSKTPFSINYSEKGEKKYLLILPFKVGSKSQAYAYVLSVSLDSKSTSKFRIIKLYIFLIFLLGIISSFIIGRILSLQTFFPLLKINKAMRSLAIGELNEIEHLPLHRKDEIGTTFFLIDSLKKGFKNLIQFAISIKQGDYDYEYKPFGETDILGHSLIGLQTNLKELQTEQQEIRKKEEIRNWVNTGISHFSSFLRRHSKNLSDFTAELIQELVEFSELEIGGIYLLSKNNKSKKILHLIATYAYDRIKYIDKEIQIREGLVGTCAAEEATIYLQKIPENYISIATGMGETAPGSLILIPLKVESRIIGVLELASIKEMDDYLINFLEKLADNISLTIASVQINEQTDKLLTKLQSSSDELRSQEEELRQNLEELQTTQEEASRRQFHLDNLVKAIDNSALTLKLNKIGKIGEINEAFQRLLDIHSVENLEGLFYNEFFDLSSLKVSATEFWKDLENGIIQRNVLKVSILNQKVWILATFTPLYDIDGTMNEVFLIGFDYTEMIDNQIRVKESKAYLDLLEKKISNYKNESLKLSKVNEELKVKYELYDDLAKRIMAIVVLDKDANIIEANNKVYEIFEIKEKSIVGRNLIEFSSFVSSTDFQTFWSELLTKDFHERNFVYNSKLYKEYYYINKIAGENKKSIVNFIIEISGTDTGKMTGAMYGGLDKFIENQFLVAEYTEEGNLLKMNENLLQLFKLESEDIKRKNHRDFAIVENVLKYHVLWSKLRSGEPQVREIRYGIENREFIFMDYYFPVKDEKNKTGKVLVISINISEMKKRIEMLTKTLNDFKKNKN